MFVQKTALNFYQLFYGIYNNKLFLQIAERDGTIKYSFESPELDMTNEKTICTGIMDASYDFFDPKHFKFDDDFVLSIKEPLVKRRHGEKILPDTKNVVSCQSLMELPAINSWLFLESFLPFEKPLQPETSPSRPDLDINNYRGAKFTNDGTGWHGMAE